MYFELHAQSPEIRKVKQIVDLLRQDKLMIYPTDTVYAYGCLLPSKQGIQQIIRLKELNPKKARFTLICRDIQMISSFTKQFDRHTFRLLNRYLPGPYTFILAANKEVSKCLGQKMATVGVRIPEHPFTRLLSEQLDHPFLSTSLHARDKIVDYLTDPEEIYKIHHNDVDMVIGCGPGGNVPSTIIDLTGDEPQLIRQGLGKDWE